MQPQNWQPRRILAVKLADLGDALMITPALRALKATYPAARLDVLTTNGGPALEGLPYVDQILFFDKYSYDTPREALQPENLGQALKFFGQLSQVGYDAVIFFHHFSLAFGALKFAGLGLATLAPVRVGLDNGFSRGWFLTHKLHDLGFGAISETDYWLELVELLGAKLPEGDAGEPEIFVSDAARATAQARLNGWPAVLALAPGGGGYSLSRRWLPIRFAQVADYFVQKHHMAVVILGSADEVALAEEIRTMMQQPDAATILAGETSVPEVVALLEGCALFVGNDGGLAHLAAVAHTPGAVVFGPTNARAWKPFYENLRVVQAPTVLPCRPCLYRNNGLGTRYGCAPRPCLTNIAAQQVIEAAEAVLVSDR